LPLSCVREVGEEGGTREAGKEGGKPEAGDSAEVEDRRKVREESVGLAQKTDRHRKAQEKDLARACRRGAQQGFGSLRGEFELGGQRVQAAARCSSPNGSAGGRGVA